MGFGARGELQAEQPHRCTTPPEQGLTRGCGTSPRLLEPPRSGELEAKQGAGTRTPSRGSLCSISEGTRESRAGPRSDPQVLRGRRCGRSRIQAAKGFPGSPGPHARPAHRLPPHAAAPGHAPPVPPHHPPAPRSPPEALRAPPQGLQPHLNWAAREQGASELESERAACHFNACIYILHRRSIPL